MPKHYSGISVRWFQAWNLLTIKFQLGIKISSHRHAKENILKHTQFRVYFYCTKHPFEWLCVKILNSNKNMQWTELSIYLCLWLMKFIFPLIQASEITAISFTFIGYKSWIMVYYGKSGIFANFNLLTLTCELSCYPLVCFDLSVDQVSMVVGSMLQQMPELWVSSLSHHIADPPFKNLERKPTLMWCTSGPH